MWTNDESKAQGVMTLITLLQSDQIVFAQHLGAATPDSASDVDELFRQLGRFRKELHNGKERYTGKGSGEQDDLAMALILNLVNAAKLGAKYLMESYAKEALSAL